VLYLYALRYYTWNDEKNKKLIVERNISFEEIIFYIEKGCLLDTLDHPNKKRYKRQRIFVVRVKNYVYLVPFVEKEKNIFLKTIIPSRKATRIYLKEDKKNGQTR